MVPAVYRKRFVVLVLAAALLLESSFADAKPEPVPIPDTTPTGDDSSKSSNTAKLTENMKSNSGIFKLNSSGAFGTGRSFISSSIWAWIAVGFAAIVAVVGFLAVNQVRRRQIRMRTNKLINQQRSMRSCNVEYVEKIVPKVVVTGESVRLEARMEKVPVRVHWDEEEARKLGGERIHEIRDHESVEWL